jgi:2-phosphosulfolactate phosphatase
MQPGHDQSGYHIRCEWGEAGVRTLAPGSDVLIIVDVLSFSTSVEIALSRGGIVFPYLTRDESAAEFAAQQGAVLASRDRGAGLTLSPASLMQIAPGTRLVLPSPNGAALSLAATRVRVVAGCLRNAAAAARAALMMGSRISVIPAGERWPDDRLRPGIEDWLGAGAIIAHLTGSKSPEALTAEEAYHAAGDGLRARVHASASGQELIERGFAEDVRIATGVNVSECVPVLRDGAYQPLEGSE